MAFSQGSRSRLSFIEEVTFGTTPSGNFTTLPFNTSSLNLSKDRVQGNEIQSDRIPRVDRHGNRQVGGDISVDLRKGDFDTLIECLMFNDFATDDTITCGTTFKSLSIEDYAADIDQARLFTGCGVSSATFSIAPNQMVTTTFSIVGSDMAISTSEKTVDAASSNQPFDSYSGDIFLNNVGGSDTAIANVTSLEFSVDNGLNPTFIVGTSATPQLEYGMAMVEGTLTAYFEDEALIDRFINETETELTVSVDDPTGSNPYEFFFPRIKINGADVSLDNPQSRIITMPFVSIYDSSAQSNLVITRTS